MSPSTKLHSLSKIFVSRLRDDRQPLRVRDRRQRFAAEPEGGDGSEVVVLAQLRRREPVRDDAQVLIANAVSVVFDLHAISATAARCDLNYSRLRVERVLEKLL